MNNITAANLGLFVLTARFIRLILAHLMMPAVRIVINYCEAWKCVSREFSVDFPMTGEHQSINQHSIDALSQF